MLEELICMLYIYMNLRCLKTMYFALFFTTLNGAEYHACIVKKSDSESDRNNVYIDQYIHRYAKINPNIYFKLNHCGSIDYKKVRKTHKSDFRMHPMVNMVLFMKLFVVVLRILVTMHSFDLIRISFFFNSPFSINLEITLLNFI